jgi:hypothetical protein
VNADVYNSAIDASLSLHHFSLLKVLTLSAILSLHYYRNISFQFEFLSSTCMKQHIHLTLRTPLKLVPMGWGVVPAPMALLLVGLSWQSERALPLGRTKRYRSYWGQVGRYRLGGTTHRWNQWVVVRCHFLIGSIEFKFDHLNMNSTI